MDEGLRDISKSFAKILRNYFVEDVKTITLAIIPYLKDLESLINNFSEKQETLSHSTNNQSDSLSPFDLSINYYHNIQNKIEAILQQLREDKVFYQNHEHFIKIVEKELSNYPNIVKREQGAERFDLDGSESFFLKLLKYIKYSLYYLSTIPKHFGNFFRKLFKKQEKPVKYWNHVFDLHDVLKGWFLWPFLSMGMQSKSGVYKKLVEVANTLASKEGNILERKNSNIVPEIDWDRMEESLEKEFLQQINDFEKEQFQILEEKISKAGTIELPNGNIKRYERKVRTKSISQSLGNDKLWGDRIIAFFEKWKFRQILYTASTEIKKSYNIFLEKLKKRTDSTIKPSITKQTAFVAGMKEKFNTINEDDLEGLRGFVVKGIYKMNKELAPQVEETTGLFFAENLLNIAENLENDIITIADHLPEKANFVKTEDFIQGSDEVDTGFFSLKEYVAFESLNQFKKGMLKVKQELTSKLEKMSKDAQDFHQILDFCFDSALDIIDHEVETQKEETPRKILVDGMNKALAKNDELLVLAESLNKRFAESIGENISYLTGKITGLQVPENLSEINLRITKAKMLQKTRQYRRRVRVFISSALKTLKRRVKLYHKKLNLFINALKRKLRLTEPETYISSELSNFLVEMYENINELPLVYRRLFELKPVDEMNLFMGRESEMKKLELAYKEWQQGNYAASIIYGENGCGKSSFIHNFIKTIKAKQKITLFKVDDFYSSKDDFYKFTEKVMEPGINNRESLDTYIESMTYKRIIIIDGIERLFLRKIKGYECLQLLLEMIAQTNKKIFWVVTVSYHAWTYLVKTLQAGDYFDYHIEMDILKDEEIKNIVLKRNRLSGYKILFQSSKEDKKSRKFQKLNLEKQQEFLEQKYFLKLNNFAKSNISLALSYWLESIQDMKNNTLYIKYFVAPGFSFLTTLSQEKIYTLMIIILHGKITTECHAEIFHHPIEKSRRILLVMNEDAILVKRGPYYIVHAILYRHVIDLLRNRNLIH